MIPLVDLAARHARHAAQIETRLLQVLRSGRYMGGPELARVEQRLAQCFGLAHGVGVASGTDALILALRAFGIGPGHRVAVPALSFFATTEAILFVGATPVFVDVRADRPLMDLSLIPSDVDAVITVPLFGMGGPEPELDLPVLCDAAQAIGWGWGTPKADACALSLYPTKTVGAAGDGGAVLSADAGVIARVRALGSHGMSAPHVHESLGRNSRLDALQAPVLLAQLDTLCARIQRRQVIATRYEAALEHAIPRDSRDAVHHFVLRHPARDAFREHLRQGGVASAVYYPTPMNDQPLVDYLNQSCPVAKQWCRELVAIPCHEDLSEPQVDHIVSLLECA